MVPPDLPVRQRMAARVLLLDKENRVLLLRFEMGDPDLPSSFWATPGGEVERDETPRQTAARELWEELHLRKLDLQGPVHGEHVEWIEAATRVLSEDIFFLARCSHGEPVLGGVSEVERRILREMRWWTIEEIGMTAERVYPAGLAPLLRRLIHL